MYVPSPHPRLGPLKRVSLRMYERRVVAGSTEESSTRCPLSANTSGLVVVDFNFADGAPIFNVPLQSSQASNSYAVNSTDLFKFSGGSRTVASRWCCSSVSYVSNIGIPRLT